jgi:protease PrsW
MRLTITSGTDAGKVLRLGRGARLRIGRSREADLELHDPKASRAHAELSVEPSGRIVLADLGSSNGTWINGMRVDTPVQLRGDERLWIGDSVLELANDDTGSGVVMVAQQSPADSQVRYRASQVANAAMLRPPPGVSGVAPSLASTDRSISTLFKAGMLILCGVLGFLTLLLLGLDADPVAYGLGLCVAFLPVPIYLSLALFIDRNEREPGWLVAIAFLWGACVAVFIALIINSVGALLVASAAGDAVAEIYGASISAPIVEESAKALVLFIIYWRFKNGFNGVLDGIVYACCVGLGFAATENVLYYSMGFKEDLQDGLLDFDTGEATFIVRGILAPFGHPLFTSMTGIGLGIAVMAVSRRKRFWAPILGLMGAMFLHFLWNSSLAVAQYGGVAGAIIALLIVVSFISLFIGMLVFINKQIKRERVTIGQYLAYDVQQGRLTQTEVDVLTTGAWRKRAVQEARKEGGKQGRDLRKAFHQATTELAFLRERIARGLIPWDAASAERHLRYEATVGDLRTRLGPLAFLPAIAYTRPQSGPVPVAPVYQAPPPPSSPVPAPPPMPSPAGMQPPPLPAAQPRDWWRQQ